MTALLPIFRLSWLPIPLLLAAMAALWVAGPQARHESQTLLLILNFLCSSVASLLVVMLVGRRFLATGSPGLLLLGCGALLWGSAGTIGPGLLRHGINVTITVHNVLVWLSAACHLAGVLLSLRARQASRLRGPILALAYAGALGATALVASLALRGWIPVFFMQGLGGTPIRTSILASAIVMFASAAAMLWQKVPRTHSAFVRWYSAALVLVAIGLLGIMLERVHGGALSWTGRAAQFLGGFYMLVAAIAAVRQSDGRDISLAKVAETWRDNEILRQLRRQTPLQWGLRYGLAVGMVCAAVGLRAALTAWLGSGLPPYILLYPAVMAVAVLLGFGPGLMSTTLAGLITTYWILPPVGRLAIAAPADRLALAIFTGMGLCMSLVAGYYRYHRDKAAALERKEALHESSERLATFANATFEGIVESEGGRIVDCNEQLAQMLGYTVAELKGREIASFIPPEEHDQVMANIMQGRDMTMEGTLLRQDGSRVVVETHGRPVTPGSARRHTAIRDITARKLAEDALRTTEERFSHMFEHHQAVMLSIDPETGAIVDANAAAARFYGYSREQLCTKSIEDINQLPPDEVAAERQRAAAEQRNHFVFPHRLANGERRWVEVYSTPVETRGRTLLFSIIHDITARKETEEALQKSEERYRMLFDTMSEGLAVHELVTDAQGQPCDYRFLDVNPQFELLTGLKRADILGKRVREVMPEIEAYWIEKYGNVALTGEPVRFENFSSPLRRWYEVFAYRPAPRQFAVIFLDITAHKNAEEALRQSDERLGRAQAMAHLGSWELDLIQNRLMWSDEVYRIFGLQPQEFTATYEAFLDCVHPDDRAKVDDAYSGSLRKHLDTYEVEHRVVRKDSGEVRVVQERCLHVRDTGGKIVRSVGMVHDITERKQAELELHASRAAALNLLEDATAAQTSLRENEARFAGIVGSAMDAIVSVDADQRITLFNAAAEKVFGYRAETVVGQPLGLLLPPDRRAVHERHVREFAATGVTSRQMSALGELVGLRSTGEQFPIEASISQIVVAGRKVLTVILRDITARKVAEKTLRETSEDLSRSNKDLEQFAYVTSHDLKEPLRMVTGFSSLLKERYGGKLDAKADQYIDYAADAAARMQVLVDDLLAYSRVGRKKETAPVEVATVLNVALRNLYAGIEESSAVITHDPLPTVNADTLELTLLFQNLIGNAIKFRKPAVPPEVHIGAKQFRGRSLVNGHWSLGGKGKSIGDQASSPMTNDPSPSSPMTNDHPPMTNDSSFCWLFSVRDNGIGIDPQFAERIFMIFQRLHTREEYPGTGVGLAICRKIVERCGGRIWVESEEGKGSTFWFTLPG